MSYSPWVIDLKGTQQVVEVTGARQGKNVIASLEGIDTRDQADALRSATIYISRDQLTPLDEGEFYWSQLEGLEVFNSSDECLGTVDHMLETGANDVMVVQGERERLIPFVLDEVVIQVDLDNRRVVVDWESDY